MPRQPRSQTICLTECRCFHVITRCTRQIHLLADDAGDAAPDAEGPSRKDFLVEQLARLATHTAVGVAGFSVMDNHLHLLLKVDTESARGWSSREVARRWLGLHPPRDGYRRRIEVEDEHVTALLATTDAADLAALREKLTSVSQFMKELKQAVSEEINRQDDTVGSVWAGRFKAVRVTDDAQLLTTLAYIDLNPFAARVCDTPEAGTHTSLAARLGRASDAGAVGGAGSDAESDAKSDAEPDADAAAAETSDDIPEIAGWWMTVGGGEPRAAASWRSLMPGTTLTFGRYLRLLDHAARRLRPGKRALAPDSRPILERLAVTPEGLAHTLCGWFERGAPWERPRLTLA